jgi:hypothetical protein
MDRSEKIRYILKLLTKWQVELMTKLLLLTHSFDKMLEGQGGTLTCNLGGSQYRSSLLVDLLLLSGKILFLLNKHLKREGWVGIHKTSRVLLK